MYLYLGNVYHSSKKGPKSDKTMMTHDEILDPPIWFSPACFHATASNGGSFVVNHAQIVIILMSILTCFLYIFHNWILVETCSFKYNCRFKSSFLGYLYATQCSAITIVDISNLIYSRYWKWNEKWNKNHDKTRYFFIIIIIINNVNSNINIIK